jgi:Fusaric acid resistance protein family
MSTRSLAAIEVRRLRDWLLFTLTVSSGAVGAPPLVGLRLWASVCLALYVAFWLQLDNAFWAGTAAALACQPPLGASMRSPA